MIATKMLPALLLGITLGYFALTVPHSPGSKIKEDLIGLTRGMSLSLGSRRRLSQVLIVNGEITLTQDKRLIYLCTSGPDGQPFDINTVRVAAIHELAHVICEEEGHGPSFQSTEEELLSRAERMGYITSRRVDPSYPCRL